MQRRTNQEWIEQLRGNRGYRRQEEAHQELGKYVYDVTYNYLRDGQDKSNPYFLGTLTVLSLKDIAQNMAQDLRAKISDNNVLFLNQFELLDQSEEDASFAHWAVSVIVFEELRGNCGRERQEIAFQCLGAFLYRTVYSYLVIKRAKAEWYLGSLHPEELKQLSQNFTQNIYQRVICEHFALLKGFKARGNFYSWFAVIVQREASNELRKWYWQKMVPPKPEPSSDEKRQESAQKGQPLGQVPISPENAAIRQQIMLHFSQCFKAVSKNQQVAFWERMVEERKAREVANIMNKTSTAVDQLLFRAKRKLRVCLQKKGWNAEDIREIFGE